MDLLRLELHGIVLRTRSTLAEVDQIRQDDVKLLRQRPDLAAPVAARIGTHAVKHEQIRFLRIAIVADVQGCRRCSHERIMMHIMFQMLAGVLVLPAEHGRLAGLGEEGMSRKEENKDEAHGSEGKEKFGGMRRYERCI